MPRVVHQRLAATARQYGLKGERFRAYVYGTLSKIEVRRQTKAKAKRTR